MTSKRKVWNIGVRVLVYAAAALTVVLLVGILGYVLMRGIPNITPEFLLQSDSVLKETMGIFPLIVNTLCIIVLSLIIALPLGVGAAIYLTEYATNKKLIRAIEYTTETLAGIPSIIYGLVGMLLFVRLTGSSSLVAGSLTLVIMILPTVIRTTQESLKTVPMSYREGALALGAKKWYMIRTIILPSSLDGIVTGCILSVGRIVGESAALLFTAGAGKLLASNVLDAYFSSGATLSVGLYMYAFEEGKYDVSYAIGAVLLVLVLIINICAKLSKKMLKPKV
ncbi:MAG TPA: phosphate ABC transporter permease PstA [Firmicutes bacterium]|nr:phosphate ABC transporter permease PstA [Bacillota bacterium]